MEAKDILRKPLVLVAGRPYPDIPTIRREVGGDHYSTMSDVDIAVSAARHEFFADVIHLRGVTDIIRELKRGQE